MRKFTICSCIILSTFSLISCKQKSIDNNITINVGKSSNFTEDEVNKAITLVKNNFNFPASTLTSIWYDEEKSNSSIEDYITTGKGSVNGVDPKNVIVLLSNFDVGDSSDNMSLTPNTTYSDYKWILIRDNKSDEWKIDDRGY